MTCECGKDLLFSECCGRFLDGPQRARTCEELVRSRFVAFGLGNFDYIEATQTDPLPDEVRQRQLPEWERLEIVACRDGGTEDQTGVVEFRAHYKLEKRRIHCETSNFVRVDGEWRYKDGLITDLEASDAGRPKLGRNHPCHCGSGRKFKHCCGV